MHKKQDKCGELKEKYSNLKQKNKKLEEEIEIN